MDHDRRNGNSTRWNSNYGDQQRGEHQRRDFDNGSRYRDSRGGGRDYDNGSRYRDSRGGGRDYNDGSRNWDSRGGGRDYHNGSRDFEPRGGGRDFDDGRRNWEPRGAGRDFNNGGRNWGPRGGGRGPSPRELEFRAKSRRESLVNLDRHWKGVGSNLSSKQSGIKNRRRETADKAYLSILWSSSPLRPSKQDDEPSPRKESRTVDEDSDSSSDGSSRSSSSRSGDSSSSDSSSSESHESDRRSRRRGGRRGRNSSRRSRRDSLKRKRPPKSRKSRRRRSPSSNSDSSSDSSSRSNSSNASSNESEKRHDKKVKFDDNTDENKIETEAPISDLNDSDLREAQAFKKAVQGANDEEEEEEGPMPLQQSSTGGGGGNDGSASYGKALLPGEGQALAQYVQQNLRIPRRGEIGYSGDDIDHWENSGYVMSGSRHTRMNAVRIRKENQVYSAEEQRALALLTMEENQQKEAQLMEDFRTMLKEKKKLRDQGM